MDHRTISYLRPLRRRWGLTQRELAFLLGARTHSQISQIEALRAYPSLANAMACAIIFDTPLFELFPELYTKVCRAVLSRAEDLYQDMQGSTLQITRTKLDFLEEVLGRAYPNLRDSDV